MKHHITTQPLNKVKFSKALVSSSSAALELNWRVEMESTQWISLETLRQFWGSKEEETDDGCSDF